MLKRPLSDKSPGFVLIEALIAVAIFSFALLGLMAMQGLAIKDSIDAKYRADAAYLANQLIAKMWVDRTNIASYAYRNKETACNTSATAPTYAAVTDWLADIAADLPGVSANATSQKPQVVVDTTTSPTYNTVTITMCWKSPSDTGVHTNVTIARINN